MPPPGSADAPHGFAIDLNRSVPHVKPECGAESPSSVAVGLALLVHLTADLVLLLNPQLRSEMGLMFALAVPIAQVSLVALWAATCAVPPYVRLVITVLGTAWGWYVMITGLRRLVVGSAESAAWAAGLVTQVVVILAFVAARSLWLQFRAARKQGPDGRDAGRWCRYSVGSLLGWTTVAAVLLGLGQTARWFGWNAETLQSGDFRFLCVVSVFNAAYALLVTWSLLHRRRLVVRIAVALLIIGAAAAAEPRVLRLLLGSGLVLDHVPASILAGTQTLLLYATLVPVRLCRWLGERKNA